MAVYTCSPCASEAEAGQQQVWGQPEIPGKAPIKIFYLWNWKAAAHSKLPVLADVLKREEGSPIVADVLSFRQLMGS